MDENLEVLWTGHSTGAVGVPEEEFEVRPSVASIGPLSDMAIPLHEDGLIRRSPDTYAGLLQD